MFCNPLEPPRSVEQCGTLTMDSVPNHLEAKMHSKQDETRPTTNGDTAPPLKWIEPGLVWQVLSARKCLSQIHVDCASAFLFPGCLLLTVLAQTTPHKDASLRSTKPFCMVAAMVKESSDSRERTMNLHVIFSCKTKIEGDAGQ